jgi:hypothetical protein
MDYFLSQRLPHRALQTLNSCRIYLQVITLSDISSNNGKYILPEAKAGLCIPYRTSNLDWPIQGRPSPAEWRAWRHTLAYLEDKGRLALPLGYWLAAAHQQWHSYFNPADGLVLLHSETSTQVVSRVTRPTNYTTRAAMRPIYDLSRHQAASLPEASVLLPATIQADQHSTPYVNVDYSHNAIPTPAPTDSPSVPTFQQHI